VECREQGEREASPTAAIVDSQSVKSAEKGGPASIRMVMTRAKVRLEGACHLWRKIPSRRMTILPFGAIIHHTPLTNKARFRFNFRVRVGKSV
jgi:hypothetical protein